MEKSPKEFGSRGSRVNGIKYHIGIDEREANLCLLHVFVSDQTICKLWMYLECVRPTITNGGPKHVWNV